SIVSSTLLCSLSSFFFFFFFFSSRRRHTRWPRDRSSDVCSSDLSKAQWDKLSPADKQAFSEAAKEAIKANRARIDEDEKRAVGDLRAKGMAVVDTLDKTKFQAA